ncbi:MAG: hypothetical protein EA381_03315 [Planctomycetaceae bacterium]|nr:MAG: hypothetical protein EA381_03315 [Planctomycetaceae bacterium]
MRGGGKRRESETSEADGSPNEPISLSTISAHPQNDKPSRSGAPQRSAAAIVLVQFQKVVRSRKSESSASAAMLSTSKKCEKGNFTERLVANEQSPAAPPR